MTAGSRRLRSLGSCCCQTTLLTARPESLTATGDCDACTAGEEQLLGHLVTGGGDVLSESVSDDLRHTRLVASPVDLKPLGITLVEVVGGDEVEAYVVRIGADAADDDGRET